MSVDYYLVDFKTKTYMPAFSFVTMGGGWTPDTRWFEKFIFSFGGEAQLLHEDSDKMPNCDEKESEWTFINAWQPFKEDSE